MRAGIVLVFVAVLIGLGPASSAGVFPDLPGMDLVEETMSGDKAAQSFSGPAEAADTGSDDADRMPAPDSEVAADEAATAQDTAVVRELPGGEGLPIFEELSAEGERSEPLAPMILLAVAVVVLFSRFLVRLNSL